MRAMEQVRKKVRAALAPGTHDDSVWTKMICGVCGNYIPWDVADLDHKIPRHRFKPLENGDALENLWILHREPCHRIKTKRDLQRGGRVR